MMMRTRIITALIAVAVFLPFLIFSDTWLFGFAMAICACGSVFEMLRCVGLHKKLLISLPLLGIGAALPFIFIFPGDIFRF
jgi:CDP-diglyceride synthetase